RALHSFPTRRSSDLVVGEGRVMRPRVACASILLAILTLCGCAFTPQPPARTGLSRIDHIIVIYAENRSFDNLYGIFPGANGIPNATPAQYTQVDRDGTPLPELPPAWRGKEPDPVFPWRMPNRPFRLDAPPLN